MEGGQAGDRAHRGSRLAPPCVVDGGSVVAGRGSRGGGAEMRGGWRQDRRRQAYMLLGTRAGTM